MTRLREWSLIGLAVAMRCIGCSLRAAEAEAGRPAWSEMKSPRRRTGESKDPTATEAASVAQRDHGVTRMDLPGKA
jgi:hypothetical protein